MSLRRARIVHIVSLSLLHNFAFGLAVVDRTSSRRHRPLDGISSPFDPRARFAVAPEPAETPRDISPPPFVPPIPHPVLADVARGTNDAPPSTPLARFARAQITPSSPRATRTSQRERACASPVIQSLRTRAVARASRRSRAGECARGRRARGRRARPRGRSRGAIMGVLSLRYEGIDRAYSLRL